jgi:hypothetical protein
MGPPRRRDREQRFPSAARHHFRACGRTELRGRQHLPAASRDLYRHFRASTVSMNLSVFVWFYTYTFLISVFTTDVSFNQDADTHLSFENEEITDESRFLPDDILSLWRTVRTIIPMCLMTLHRNKLHVLLLLPQNTNQTTRILRAFPAVSTEPIAAHS